VSIAPIVKSVTVPLPPERAFALFTEHMDRWWKPDMHVGATPYAALVVEPREGGRWFERDAEGRETQWGTVLAWEPPHRLLLGWQLNARFQYDPDFLTEVELTFRDHADGAEVRLEHRQLERFGDDGARLALGINDGWGTLMARYAECAKKEEGND
jgi:uncharacterized protein YndB with AHSA1/START domain